jgi:hypothetical protein
LATGNPNARQMRATVFTVGTRGLVSTNAIACRVNFVRLASGFLASLVLQILGAHGSHEPVGCVAAECGRGLSAPTVVAEDAAFGRGAEAPPTFRMLNPDGRFMESSNELARASWGYEP